MAEPFIAEIRLFPYNFAPKNWAFCAGQLIPIRQNTALFSLLGTTYGGNGTTIFALPNLIGQAAMGAGSGPGLTRRDLGETGGSTTVTIDASTFPAHTHALQGFDNAQAKATTNMPANNQVFARANDISPYQPTTTAPVAMSGSVLSPSNGGGLPHNNMQPFLVVNACIALQGLFPQRP